MVIYWSKIRRPVYGTATVKELNCNNMFTVLQLFWSIKCSLSEHTRLLSKPRKSNLPDIILNDSVALNYCIITWKFNVMYSLRDSSSSHTAGEMLSGHCLFTDLLTGTSPDTMASSNVCGITFLLRNSDTFALEGCLPRDIQKHPDIQN